MIVQKISLTRKWKRIIICTPMQMTIYFAPEERDTVKRAKLAAKSKKESVSSVVLKALRVYAKKVEAQSRKAENAQA